MEVGRIEDRPLKDCYEIGSDICHMACISDTVVYEIGSDICRMACISDTVVHDIRYLVNLLGNLWDQHKDNHDIRYLINTLKTLWDQHKDEIDIEIKSAVLKVKE